VLGNKSIFLVIFQHCGFITFDKPESAERSIVELNGTSVEGIDLKVKE
jgi:RNA recognition motif-containing protein